MPTSFVRIVMGFVLGASILLCSSAQAGEITQHFPADQPVAGMQTQWRIVWGIEQHAGQSEVLFIQEAYFKRGPAEPEIKVIGDSRLAEIFVPYNNGKRVYDISNHYFKLANLDRKALGPACVLPGTIYNRAGEKADIGPVISEVHDGHIRWMNMADKIRRGQSLIVWSVLRASNYRYILLYQFRDDGVIGFRLGATAHNLHNTADDCAAHVHLGCWRINVELGNANQTKVGKVHFDSTALKTVLTDLEKESRFRWTAEEFTRLRVTSRVEKNKHQPHQFVSYELVPVRMGSGRYFGIGEEFTHDDFWITRRRSMPNELRPRLLPTLVDEESLTGCGITLWHHAPVLHVPRDEDFGKNGTLAKEGVAITNWAGCDLMPRNFFPSTPLYP